MLRRIKRIFLYKYFPILLSVFLLFSISVTSGVFSPKRARAVALVDDIVIGGTIIAWLSAAGVAISGSLGDGNSTPEAMIDGLKELTYQYDTFVNNAVGTIWNQLIGAYLDTEIFLEETIVQPTISIANDAWKLLSGFNDWLVDTFSIVSSQTIISNIYSNNGFYLDDGSPITYYVGSINSSNQANSAFSSLPNTSKFEVGQRYTNWDNVSFYCTENGDVYTWTYDSNGVISDFFSWTVPSTAEGTSLLRYAFGKPNNANRTIIRELINSSGNIVYNYGNSTSSDFINAFDSIFQPTESSIDGLGKDLLPELETSDYPTESSWIQSSWDTLVDSLPLNPTLEDVAGAYLDLASSGAISAEDDNVAERVIADNPPAPEPVPTVELPLIGIRFPSGWSLNLSGIWSYVRDWVQSIGSWFSWMFGVFSSLPYAMVVPIYASAVIVIVLGIYRRFFM